MSCLPPSAPKVLLAVRQRSLSDTVVQLLRDDLPGAQWLPACTQDDFERGVRLHPALVIADASTFFEYWNAGRNSSPLLALGDSPLILVLPFDSRNYRDAAVAAGVNGLVIESQLVETLRPTVRRLLCGARLMAGVPSRRTPDGEMVSRVEMRSRDAIRRLSPRFSRVSSTSVGVGHGEELVRLRGLQPMSAALSLSSGQHRTARTACNLNCGNHYCGLQVTVRGDHVVQLEAADFPDARYRRVCLKGISQVQLAAHPQRLLYPLKRRGARGEGNWERISWGQALDEIADQMRALADQHGPHSLMFFPYSGQLSVLNGIGGAYLRLASALGASGTDLSHFGLDSGVPGGLEDTFGVGSGYLANDFTDLPNSRLILIWGGDPVQSRMNWWRFFLEARQAGARLVTIDPRFTATASKSDEWLPIRVGTDLYLALALAHVLLHEGGVDCDFVLAHTAGPLLVRQDTGEYLRGNTSHDPFRVWDQYLRKAVSITEAVQPALTGCYRVNGVSCRPSYDLLMDLCAHYTPELAESKTGLPAARIRALAHELATRRPARIFTLYGVDRWHHAPTFGRWIGILAALTGNLGRAGAGAGVDGLNEPLFLAHDFASPGGLRYRPLNAADLPDAIEYARPYAVRAVLAAFNNWFNQWPNQNRLRGRVLSSLDLLVTVDLFMTETARWSDYVLPAAHLFEREDMVKGPGPYVQHQPAIVPPPGECRSDLEIAAGLARRLGQGRFFDRTPREYLAEIFSSSPMLQGLSFENFVATGLVERNLPPEAGIAHANLRFSTPTGRVEFSVERLLPLGRALPVYEPPIEADPEGDLIQRFPLVCLTEHSRYRVHSSFVNVSWLRELDPEPCALVHPVTATERGLRDGDLGRIYNDRGGVVLRIRVSQSVPPQAVYISQGWQSDDFYAGHVQTLTHSLTNPANPLGPNSAFSDVLVEVEPVGREEG